MKIALKMLIAAILSLTVGIACASPLLVTELNIRPWINQVQGVTAQFEVKVVYANFTLQNGDKPVTQDSGPTISYFAVVNITNLSNLDAKLTSVNFLAAQKITNNTEPSIGNSTSAIATSAEGAWVDGKWYNVTWVNVTYPYFDENGNFHQPVFKLPGEPYWMEGVQVYDIYANGTLTTTYLNMNGTWTDVTGRVTMNHPTLGSNGQSVVGVVADDVQSFDTIIDNSVKETGSNIGATRITHHLVDQPGLFNATWLQRESRLMAVSGSWNVHLPFADPKAVESLQSGNLTFHTQISNLVEEGLSMVNNTLTTTWSDATELKQVQLTQNGNSYIYNPLSLDNQAFQIDKWGIEVFINPRSQTP